MFVYLVLLGFFAIGALAEAPRTLVSPQGNVPWPGGTSGAAGPRPTVSKSSTMLVIGALMTIAIIGFRYRNGGDWYSYLDMFNSARRASLLAATQLNDPGYGALNWATAKVFGNQFWAVDLLSGGLFGWGLFRLCNVQPRPWLAFAAAVPYMVIVVAMGYQRQSIALGFLMAGLARQSRGASSLNFAMYCAAAAIFHSTAVVVFPIVALSARGSRVINALVVVALSFVLYQSFLVDRMDGFVRNYVDVQYSSSGALVRVAMNVLAAIAFLLVGKRLEFSPSDYKLWRNFSVAAIVMLLLFAVLPSSTAVDRVSLYLLPLQVAILSRLPQLGNRSVGSVMAVILYLLTVELVWLNFGQFASAWVPYHFYPLLG